jgi:hypothetical protein
VESIPDDDEDDLHIEFRQFGFNFFPEMHAWQ